MVSRRSGALCTYHLHVQSSVAEIRLHILLRTTTRRGSGGHHQLSIGRTEVYMTGTFTPTNGPSLIACPLNYAAHIFRKSLCHKAWPPYPLSGMVSYYSEVHHVK